MVFSDLAPDERLALVALVKRLVMTDRAITEEEAEAIDAIAGQLGEETYRALMERADREFAGEPALKTFLARIDRQAARDFIYGTLLAGVIGDTTQHTDAQFLAWLADAWAVTVEIGDEGNP